MDNRVSSTLDTVKMLVKQRKGRILIVDDEEFCMSAMKAILKVLGVDYESRVDFCLNGLEAYDMIVNGYQLGLSYFLILTDFSMPVMDGIESISLIRKYLGDKMHLKRQD